jgi:probable O-glycosylation ligase (exosortase A-associated)
VSLTAILFWIVYAGGVCTAVARPVVGVALYILVYHLNPETQWWGESFAATGLRPSLTVAAATALGIILRRPRLSPGARQFPLQTKLMLALALYALLTLTWADLSFSRSLFMGDKVVKLAIFAVILVRCVRRPEHYHLVIVAWLIGVAYIGYQAHGGVGGRSGGRLAWGLGGPDFAESSDLAVHLVGTLPIIGAMVFMARKWWARVAWLVTGALAVNTIIATRTRNAVVGLAAVTCVAVLWLPRGYRAKGIVAIAAGMLLAAQLADPGWWRRMRTIQDYKSDASAARRIVYWQAAVDMVTDYPFGVGLGQFHYRVGDYLPDGDYGHSAHNTFMTCLAELGLPGMTLFLAAILVALRRTSQVRKAAYQFRSDITLSMGYTSPRFHLAWHAMALQSGLVGYLACSLFTTRLWAEGLWILLGLTACLQNACIHMESAAQTTGVEEPLNAGVPPLGTWPVANDSGARA